MTKHRGIDEFLRELADEAKSGSDGRTRRSKKRRPGKTILDFLAGTTREERGGERPRTQAKRSESRPASSGLETRSESVEGTRPVAEPEEPVTPRASKREPRVLPRLVSASISLETEKTSSWYLGEKNDIVESVTGYLMDVRYDGQAGKAVLYIYDPSKGRITRWYDRSKHRPYFLLKAEPGPELARKFSRAGLEQYIASIETVTKFHPITRRNVKLVRLVTTDPLAVKKLRDVAKSNGIPYYEADIRYHHNYIYDKHLIPGLIIRADKDAGVTEYEADPEAVKRVLEAFSDEPEEVQRRAVKWIPMFEQEPPSPRILAVDIEVYTPFEGELPDPEQAPYPVFSVALVSSTGRRRVLLLDWEGARPGNLEDIDGDIEIFDDEASLILEVFREIDNHDIIVTFNGDSFDIPYLYNRLIVLGFPPWLIPVEFHQTSVTFRNQLHIDLYKFFDIRALQVYAFGNKYREKNLDTIAEALLGKRKVSLEKPISELDIATLAKYNLTDAMLTMELLTFGNNLVWNLMVLLMRISKLGLEDVTRSQVSAWIKSLLHWEHRNRGWLIPSREDIARIGNVARSSAIIKDKKYKGAIVLKPPQGVFFNIVVLDFASLYPSVIKNWNLSYETVNNPACPGEKRKVPEVGHEVCMAIKGLTSEIVGLLRDFRVKIYKRKAKDKSLPETARLWFNTVQAAMKVYINASYGVFGNETFAYYSLAVAESVTAIGRAVLKDTLQQASRLGLMILYGDTDSIFVWDPPEEKLEEIMRYVREKHSLDLEVDKVFRLALFSGLKKNYIGVSPEGDVVIKGMVGKKSNTPEFLKKEFTEATRILAGVKDPEGLLSAIEAIRNHIEGILKKLKNREYMLDELAIKVMLSKDPKEYTKNTPQHVKAALLLRKYGLRVTKGTVVTFVKTRDKLGVRPVKLARLPDVDTSKYQELVRTVFEQMLMSLGLSWNRLLGQKNLLFAGFK
ncbi:MAG: DNA-directed DNA polymerase I [Desulfurococcales archaeon]|nr:DNA-directed DNA polymerase I [Desulfurococcales archaeon]